MSGCRNDRAAVLFDASTSANAKDWRAIESRSMMVSFTTNATQQTKSARPTEPTVNTASLLLMDRLGSQLVELTEHSASHSLIKFMVSPIQVHRRRHNTTRESDLNQKQCQTIWRHVPPETVYPGQQLCLLCGSSRSVHSNQLIGRDYLVPQNGSNALS
ncbi:MAG: hypothetical protein ACI9HK_004262 [Pirellulaceae bacterium]|jgi:hypothetical protein